MPASLRSDFIHIVGTFIHIAGIGNMSKFSFLVSVRLGACRTLTSVTNTPCQKQRFTEWTMGSEKAETYFLALQD